METFQKNCEEGIIPLDTDQAAAAMAPARPCKDALMSESERYYFNYGRVSGRMDALKSMCEENPGLDSDLVMPILNNLDDAITDLYNDSRRLLAPISKGRVRKASAKPNGPVEPNTAASTSPGTAQGDTRTGDNGAVESTPGSDGQRAAGPIELPPAGWIEINVDFDGCNSVHECICRIADKFHTSPTQVYAEYLYKSADFHHFSSKYPAVMRTTARKLEKLGIPNKLYMVPKGVR